jgi:hypothetical protein
MFISKKRYAHKLDEAESRGMGKAYRDIQVKRREEELDINMRELRKLYDDIDCRTKRLEYLLNVVIERCNKNDADFRARLVNALEKGNDEKEGDK